MIRPVQLTCEYETDPLGVDTLQPRLNWMLESNERSAKQTCYRVLVASSAKRLAADEGDLWDSGTVESDRSVNVPYEGEPLRSGQACFWRVHAGQWSESATFTMGLLDPADWQGRWIAFGTNAASPIFRKPFELDGQIVRAIAHVTGLGWNELYLNGQRVGDDVLNPAVTDYKERALYSTYDVTDLLAGGPNAVGVMLGNGWYSEPGWPEDVVIKDDYYGDSDWPVQFGGERPQVLLQLDVEYADGRTDAIVTDESWRATNGPIARDDFFGGETYDARAAQPGWSTADFDDTHWARAELTEPPLGKLTAQIMPPIRVTRTLRPKRVTQPTPGVHVVHFDQLFGGWIRLRVKGQAGAKVTIRYSARLDEQTGLIQPPHSRPDAASDEYILRGDPAGEQYEPRFTYHGTQYVQIEGYPGALRPADVDGCVVHSDVDLAGEFTCSDEVLNRIHRNVSWTLTNGLYGMPLDCLYREHWAWIDPATVTGSLYPRKHMPAFWTKWLADVADAQYENGFVPSVCPNYRGDGFDPAWGGNYPILVWYLARTYDDQRLLEAHYDGMKRCVDYLTSTANEYIVSNGVFGDHMIAGDAPGQEDFISLETPPPLVWTGYYYRAAAAFAATARTLGRTEDAAHYAELAEDIADAFNAKWFDPAAETYDRGSQTANAFPLALGIVPDAHRDGVLGALVKEIVETHDEHLHTGNTGTTCLIDTLAANGHADLMHRIATQPTYPGWGYMVARGATTIWESWSLQAGCGNAESMIMWAPIDGFFYTDLAGIRGPNYYGPDAFSPGYSEIEIRPHVPAGVDFVRATLATIRGWISSAWSTSETLCWFEIDIPANTTARVSIPTLHFKDPVIAESGEPIWKDNAFVQRADGVTTAQHEAGRITFAVGSGAFRFTLTGAR